MYKILKAEKLADKIYLNGCLKAPRVAMTLASLDSSLSLRWTIRENVSHLQSVTMTEKQVLLQSYSRKSEYLL